MAKDFRKAQTISLGSLWDQIRERDQAPPPVAARTQELRARGDGFSTQRIERLGFETLELPAHSF